MLASSFLDPVLGLDVHFEMVPTPAPVPTPIPNPFIGIVFDPVGLACGIALGAAIGAVMGAPFQGPVLYWTAFPATNTGTEAKAVPGHILIPPGVAWAPFPKTPKPVIHPGETPKPALPIKPEDDAVVVFGSKTVTVMGSNAVRLGDIALSCSEPLRLPFSVVLAVPKGAPILIGGPMSLDIMAAIMASLRTRFVSDSLHALISRLKPSRFRNLLHRAACFLTGHPVDVASGKVMTEFVDVELPGPMPLKIVRLYSSAFASRSSVLGHGWSLSIDQAVWRERGKVVLLAEDGREIEFDTFDFPHHRIEVGQQVYDPFNRLTLHCEAEGRFRVVNHEGGTREFAPVGRSDGRAMLVRTRSRCGGFEHRHEYDVHGRPSGVVDACGRRITLTCDGQGRVTAIHLPSASGEGHECVRRYVYDDEGDLVEVRDALDQAWRFVYATHLLVQETDRKGLSFHFAYDGLGEDAWCVRTWGDEGIYDHAIAYDKRKRATFVTNSRGHTTQYHMNLAGQVVEIVDPLGGKTRFEYDPHTLVRTREIDPLGRALQRDYDTRGNLVRVVEKDGATTELRYDGHDRLVAARELEGREWGWRHDGQGRVIERRGAEGVTRYGYVGSYLSEIIDPGGRVTQFGYVANGMLDSMRVGDDAPIRWTHDGQGRVIASEEGGRVRRMHHDALGRLTEIREPDGELRTARYDPEGNVLVARQGKREVHYQYAGLGKVAVRREAGTELRFEYDTEQRLREVVNELGQAHTIELDERGFVRAERRFDASRYEFVRDVAGQIVELRRPSGKASRYVHDDAGRVIEVTHADGQVERYRYGLDGLVIEAHNDAASVVLERDLGGRVVREWQDDRWVESDYDVQGRRIGMRSCFGALEQIERNALGDPIALRYREGAAKHSEQVRPIWAATIERALGGEELERHLPGGLRSRWRRDTLGRTLQRQIWTEAGVQLDHRYRREGGEIREIVDDLHATTTRFGHDAVGNLAWTHYGDGSSDLRIPDPVGNLFRRLDRDDRSYGPAGQLLLAATSGGTLRYVYDADGQLVERREPGGVWRFAWSANGNLSRVERPDGTIVEFEYDALGRRVRKRCEGRTTHWLWAGRVPIHEWVDAGEVAHAAETDTKIGGSEPAELPTLDVLLGEQSPRGPPAPLVQAAPAGLITWLFEPSTFIPTAKIVDGRAYSILADHRGAPIAMFDDRGVRVWSAEIDVYGALRRVETAAGFDRCACPFRYQGQYEDAETGLYYNRFRYYDPSAGQYISQDPIDLRGGPRLYAYVRDPLHYVYVLGLTYTGGRHRDTRLPTNDGMDSHHMPAKATYADSALTPGDGPAIKMDPSDHRQTASYGASAGSPEFDVRRQSILDARAARAAGDMDGAKRIIDDAILRDIADAQAIARSGGDPSKYDKAILEMMDSLDDDFYDRITREKSSPPCS